MKSSKIESKKYMQKVNFPKEFFTRNFSPRQSTINSPKFSRSERTTHKSTSNFNNEMSSQLTSGISLPTSKNFITEKSQILMRVDSNLEQKIKKKIILQKMNSKMSILSMQKSKFKVIRTKSSFKLSTSFTSGNLNNSELSLKKDSHMLCSIQGTQRRNSKNVGFSQFISFQSFRSYMQVVLLNHPKKQNERKNEMFSRDLINYFIEAQDSEMKKSLSQIKSLCKELLACLSDNSHEMQLGIMRLVDRDISKLLLNMCYQIYRKKQKKVNYQELIRINKDMEYSARRLKFFELTLRILLDLGQLYCDQMQYEKAFQQYTHAVKLAIFINSKYYMEIAIDKLGICKYYMGDSVSALYFHNNLNHISNYDISRVKTQYSNQKEIQRLIDQKNQFKPSRYFIFSKNNSRKRVSKTNIFQDQQNPTSQSYSEKIDIGQFTFEKQNRNEFYPLMNNFEMKSNLKKIIKMPDLRDKVHVLKRNLKKNDFIGTKRYCGQTYVIPSASTCIRRQNNLQMNEVCLSHRSFNRHDTQAYCSNLDRDSRVLVTVLNYFMNQNFIGKQY